MANARITDVFDAPATDPARTGQTDVVVLYMVDGRGPFRHRSPKTGFDINRVTAEITTTERARSQIVGRTFQV